MNFRLGTFFEARRARREKGAGESLEEIEAGWKLSLIFPGSCLADWVDRREGRGAGVVSLRFLFSPSPFSWQ